MMRQESRPTDPYAAPLASRLSAESLRERAIAAHERNHQARATRARQPDEAPNQIFPHLGDASGPSLPGQRSAKLEARILADRSFRLLKRSDAAIRDILVRECRMDAVVDASQPSNLDELLWFIIEDLELTKAFSELAPPKSYVNPKTGKEVKRRQNLPVLILNLLGVMRRYLGSSSNPDIQANLLMDPRWMRLLGFTHEEVLYGVTE